MNYFVMAARPVKVSVLVIFLLALAIRRTSIVRRCYMWLSNVPTGNLVFVVLSIAFLLRFGWVIWSPHTAPSASSEDVYILRHAHDLATGKGYITDQGKFSADRPVGYAIWLATFFKVFGERIWLIELSHVVFEVITVFLIFYIGKQTLNREVGFFASILLALYPTSIFASKIVLEEHMFIPIWLIGIILLISDFQKPHWYKVISAGLIFGIASHFRTYAFAMGLVVFFLWFLVKKNRWQGLSRALIVQLLILALALPWAIRNYQKLGEPILYTTWIGSVLYYANNQISDVRYPVSPTPEQGGDPDFVRATNEVDRNRTGKKAALKWISQHPGVFVQKAIGRVIYMLGINREGWAVKDNFNTIRVGRMRSKDTFIRNLDKLDNDYYGNVFLLALFGFAMFYLRRKTTLKQQSFWCILLTLAYYLVIVAVTIGHRKYRFAIEPLFCLLAGYALYLIWFEHVAKSSACTEGDIS